MGENKYIKCIMQVFFMPSRTSMRKEKSKMRLGKYGGPHMQNIREFAHTTQDALIAMAKENAKPDDLKMARLHIHHTDEVHVEPEVSHDFNNKATVGGLNGVTSSRLFVAATADRAPAQMLEEGLANSNSVWMISGIKAGIVSGYEGGAFAVRNMTSCELLEQQLLMSTLDVVHGGIDVLVVSDAASTNVKAWGALATGPPLKIEPGEKLPANAPLVWGYHHIYPDIRRHVTLDGSHAWKSFRSQIVQGGDTKDLLFQLPGAVLKFVSFSWKKLEFVCRQFIDVWVGTARPMVGGTNVSIYKMFAAVKQNSTKMNVPAATRFFSTTFQKFLSDRVVPWLAQGRPKSAVLHTYSICIVYYVSSVISSSTGFILPFLDTYIIFDKIIKQPLVSTILS